MPRSSCGSQTQSAGWRTAEIFLYHPSTPLNSSHYYFYGVAGNLLIPISISHQGSEQLQSHLELLIVVSSQVWWFSSRSKPEGTLLTNSFFCTKLIINAYLQTHLRRCNFAYYFFVLICNVRDGKCRKHLHHTPYLLLVSLFTPVADSWQTRWSHSFISNLVCLFKKN